MNYSYVNNEELPKLTRTEQRLLDEYMRLDKRQTEEERELLANHLRMGHKQVQDSKVLIRATLKRKNQIRTKFKKLACREIEEFIQ